MIEWKVAYYGKRESIAGVVLSWWCKQIEERSGGRVKIKVYMDEELFKQPEMLKAVKAKKADVAYCGIPLYPDAFPLSSVCYIPFMPPIRIDHQVLTMNELVKTSPLIREELDKQNVVFGYNYSSLYYNLMGNKAIRTVDDLKGVRIKCLPPTYEVWKKFGATRVWFGAPETLAALQRNDIDVVNFAGPVNMYDWGLHKVSKYYMHNVSLGGSRSYMLINKDSWNALPEDVKGIF